MGKGLPIDQHRIIRVAEVGEPLHCGDSFLPEYYVFVWPLECVPELNPPLQSAQYGLIVMFRVMIQQVLKQSSAGQRRFSSQ